MLVATLLAYFAALLVIGAVAAARTRNESDFFLGGRRFGAVIVAIGASASSSSAWTLLGVSGAAYAWGVSALWLFPACVGGFVLNWFVMAPLVRRAGHEDGAVTLIDLLVGKQSGRIAAAIRVVAAAIILVSLGAYIASQFQGAGKTFQDVFQVPQATSVSIGAAVILAYVFLGGFIAVGLTDTLQGVVMAVTAVFLPLVALSEVGGLSALYQRLAGLDLDGFLALGGPRPLILGVGFAVGLLGIGLGYPGQPHVLKYFLAMSRDASVPRGRTIAILWAVCVYAGMFLLGLCGRALFPALADGEVVLVRAATELLHPAVAGVMLAAVLSAMMSTADSQLLVASATVAHDLRRGASVSLLRSRVVVVLLTVAAAAAALIGSDRIFSRVLFGWAAMGAAFGPVLLVRLLLRRTLSARATLAVVTCGFGLAAGAHLFYDSLSTVTALRNVAIHVVPFSTAMITALLCSKPAERAT